MNAHFTNTHRQSPSEASAAGGHVVLVPDGAGWHATEALQAPATTTLLSLPPDSPEPNPVERVWATCAATN